MVQIHGSSLNYLPVEGHLDCFQFGALQVKGYKHPHTFLCKRKFLFLLGKFLGVKLLAHLVNLFNFLRNSQTAFQKNYHFMFPSAADCSITLPAFGIVIFLSYSKRCLVVFHCDFNLQFPND